MFYPVLKYYSTKNYAVADLYLHEFLTSSLDESEWLSPRSGCFASSVSSELSGP